MFISRFKKTMFISKYVLRKEIYYVIVNCVEVVEK